MRKSIITTLVAGTVIALSAIPMPAQANSYNDYMSNVAMQTLLQQRLSAQADDAYQRSLLPISQGGTAIPPASYGYGYGYGGYGGYYGAPTVVSPTIVQPAMVRVPTYRYGNGHHHWHR